MSADKTSLFVHGIDSEMEASQIKTVVIQAFKVHGSIEITSDDINLVTDHERGGFRRFCFVLVDPSSAEEVVTNFENADQNDSEFPLVVNIARPREDRGPRTGGSFRRRDSYSDRGNSRRDW
ncbi:MAG: hypothetical protein AAGF07_04385 [Patescibacteria group bacterium]